MTNVLALDAMHLSAIHVLHLHDAEQIADFLIRVGKQVEWKSHPGLEAFMRLDAVARNAMDGATELCEFRMQVAELLAFGGAAGGVVLRIKVEDQRASQRG